MCVSAHKYVTELGEGESASESGTTNDGQGGVPLPPNNIGSTTLASCLTTSRCPPPPPSPHRMVLLKAYGDLNGRSVEPQFVTRHVNHTPRVGPCTVHPSVDVKEGTSLTARPCP